MTNLAVVSTCPSSVSTETPVQAVSSLDHLVTQWMSTVTSSVGSAMNCSQVQDTGVSTAPRIVKLQSLNAVCGVGPAESTGKSRTRCWPGGILDGSVAGRFPWNPREMVDIVGLLLNGERKRLLHELPHRILPNHRGMVFREQDGASRVQGKQRMRALEQRQRGRVGKTRGIDDELHEHRALNVRLPQFLRVGRRHQPVVTGLACHLKIEELQSTRRRHGRGARVRHGAYRLYGRRRWRILDRGEQLDGGTIRQDQAPVP